MSPWHDVALRNGDGTLNFVCEIPKDTSAKFEVATVQPSQTFKLVLLLLPQALSLANEPTHHL